jgi:hypothetical protein
MDETVNTTASVAADPAFMEAHPRRLYGKWAQAGVPHIGWQCIFTDDVEEDFQLCGMCESQEVRYVHHMWHPNYESSLEVGGDCAALMEQSSEAAARRARAMKNRARRRRNWTTRKWRVAANGNVCLKANGNWITILRSGQGWTFSVVRVVDDSSYSAASSLSTCHEAKLAAFDYIWPAKSRVM